MPLLQRLMCVCLCAFASTHLFASSFGSVTGLVHDSQHRPIASAHLTLTPAQGGQAVNVETAADGTFRFVSVEAGSYTLEISAHGFDDVRRTVTVFSDRTVDVHQQLSVGRVNQSVTVNENAVPLQTQSTTATQLIDQRSIERVPAADEANSFAMITDNVPGAVIAHDQLHVRGGHQVTWMIDGVEVPNTNIASNVGAQFDPKDASYLETSTGGYGASKGNRTYGVFNMIPKSGFEQAGAAEVVASYGSQNSSDDQLSYGNHTQRFSWFGSVGADRTDAGLETPVPQTLHDAANGQNAFASLVFNESPRDQLRFVTSARNDHYQIPNDFDLQASGYRDTEDERDIFGTFSWLHALSSSSTFIVTPFLHFNQAHYAGAASDPLVTNSDRGANYYGGSAAVSQVKVKYSLRAGIDGYWNRQNDLFSAFDNTAAQSLVHSRAVIDGSNIAAYIEAQVQPLHWLNLNAGVRGTRFSGGLEEHATDPRVGGSITLPHLHWVLYSYYGHYYQPPPLFTVADALSSAAQLNGVGFLPLRGERDVQREFGITIPWRQWALSGTHFQTSARNYFDHDVLGQSNVFLPLTISAARIRGWEATVRSPEILHARFRLAYSHQTAEGRGAVSGGLTDFSAADDTYFLLDHDQRNMLSWGGEVGGAKTWASFNMLYGSGFLDGNGPGHLPPHVTADVSVGRQLTHSLSAKLTATNITDDRYLIDRSNTFGGTHFALPRRISLQLRYRFGGETK